MHFGGRGCLQYGENTTIYPSLWHRPVTLYPSTQHLRTMVLGIISLLGIVGGIVLVLLLGFGLMFFLRALLFPPSE